MGRWLENRGGREKSVTHRAYKKNEGESAVMRPPWRTGWYRIKAVSVRSGCVGPRGQRVRLFFLS